MTWSGKAESTTKFLEQVYSSTSADQSQKLYDQWASQYDKDLAEEEYVSPELAVEAVVKNLDHSRVHDGLLKVLDAGCGTGLVGVCLKSASTKGELASLHLEVDGLDLSQGMLDIARQKGVYGKLEVADLSQKLECAEESYNVVTCVGTLTKGHVGPGVLKEFVRVVKRGGGLVVATVLAEVWESGGYKAVMDYEEKYGRIEVLGTADFGVRKGQDRGGKMVVLRRKYLAEEIAHAGIGA